MARSHPGRRNPRSVNWRTRVQTRSRRKPQRGRNLAGDRVNRSRSQPKRVRRSVGAGVNRKSSRPDSTHFSCVAIPQRRISVNTTIFTYLLPPRTEHNPNPSHLRLCTPTLPHPPQQDRRLFTPCSQGRAACPRSWRVPRTSSRWRRMSWLWHTSRWRNSRYVALRSFSCRPCSRLVPYPTGHVQARAAKYTAEAKELRLGRWPKNQCAGYWFRSFQTSISSAGGRGRTSRADMPPEM